MRVMFNRFKTNSFLTQASGCLKLWKYKNDFSLYEIPLTVHVRLNASMKSLSLLMVVFEEGWNLGLGMVSSRCLPIYSVNQVRSKHSWCALKPKRSNVASIVGIYILMQFGRFHLQPRMLSKILNGTHWSRIGLPLLVKLEAPWEIELIISFTT